MEATHPAVLIWTYIEQGDFIEAAELLTEDFQFSGPVKEPLSGPEWLGMHRMINEAFPDFAFNTSQWELDGAQAVGQAQVTGTHENDLNLTPMGIPLVPATGVSIDVTPSKAFVTLREGKIESIEMVDEADGGIRGLLMQIGAADA